MNTTVSNISAKMGSPYTCQPVLPRLKQATDGRNAPNGNHWTSLGGGITGAPQLHAGSCPVQCGSWFGSRDVRHDLEHFVPVVWPSPFSDLVGKSS